VGEDASRGRGEALRPALRALCLAALCCGTAVADEPRIGEFTRYDAGEYVIVTSGSAAKARRFVQDLVKFRLTLERMLDRKAVSNPLPTTILMPGNSDWDRWITPRRDVAGFFQHTSFADYMALNGAYLSDNALQIMFHEFTHYFMSSQFAGETPPWFGEGLAEMMSHIRLTDTSAVLEVPWWTLDYARKGDWIPFARLVAVDHNDAEYQSHKLVYMFYAESLATVRFGLIEAPDFGAQMIRYLSQVNALVPQEQAARSTFGSDLTAIDKRVRASLLKESHRQAVIRLDAVPQVKLGPGEVLGEMDAMSLLAEVMLESDAPSDRIRTLLESLQRRDPNVARTSVLVARLALGSEDYAAFDRAVDEAESALPAGDWEQRRRLARVLLDCGLSVNPTSARTRAQARADMQRASKLFGEAIVRNDHDAEALWGFGTAAARLDTQLDEAERALLRARELAPSNADIAKSLARLKLRQDQPEAALPYFKDVIRYTSDLATRHWAAQSYLQTQQYLTDRAAIAAEGQVAPK
jgi:tetratricopeptide (TPR) repeat protein